MAPDEEFSERLAMGISAENIAYDYLRRKNSYVEDLRQQKHGEFSGPCLCGTEGKVVLPDFIVYNKNPTKGTYAVEVKSKNKLYPIDRKMCFTVDDKYEQYIKAVELKRLDYLAMLFFLGDRMYLYKDSDCLGMHQYPLNKYGNGRVYHFEFDKTKIVY